MNPLEHYHDYEQSQALAFSFQNHYLRFHSEFQRLEIPASLLSHKELETISRLRLAASMNKETNRPLPITHRGILLPFS
jgi:hypothetical protein